MLWCKCYYAMLLLLHVALTVCNYWYVCMCLSLFVMLLLRNTAATCGGVNVIVCNAAAI